MTTTSDVNPQVMRLVHYCYISVPLGEHFKELEARLSAMVLSKIILYTARNIFNSSLSQLVFIPRITD